MKNLRRKWITIEINIRNNKQRVNWLISKNSRNEIIYRACLKKDGNAWRVFGVRVKCKRYVAKRLTEFMDDNSRLPAVAAFHIFKLYGYKFTIERN